MIGVTNSWNNKPRWSVDEYTELLITDTLEDKGRYQCTIENHGITISTSQKRDGRNSLYFNGAAYAFINGKMDFCCRGNNWTIETWWIPMNPTNGNIAQIRTSKRYDGQLLFGYNGNAYYNRGWYLCESSGTSWWSNSYIGVIAQTGSWEHRALVRNGNSILTFQDGTLTTHTTGYTNSIPVPDRRTGLGGYWNDSTDSAAPAYFATGYMQDFRISNTARYTANFTPPTRFM